MLSNAPCYVISKPLLYTYNINLGSQGGLGLEMSLSFEVSYVLLHTIRAGLGLAQTQPNQLLHPDPN